MNRVKTLRRAAALAGVATVALLSSVVPANADAVTGVLQEKDARGGEGIFLQGHKPDEGATHTALLALKTDKGETLKTYCVDFNTHTYKDANYTEVPWASHDAKDSTFQKNATKINWLLQNSYPMIDPDDLQAAVKKAIPEAKFTHTLTDAEAIAATQAAAWFYSDGKVLDKNKPTEHGDETKDNVLSVFGYLTSEKINKGLGEQPKPELTLDPKSLAGKPGTLIGPFTVSTSAADVVVAAQLPQGVLLTDKDGNALPDAAAAAKKAKAAAQGKYDFFVKVPADAADGKADITVSGKASLSLGRLFAVVKGKASQRLILAETQKVALETKGQATWNKGGTTTPPTTDTPVAPAKNTEELANTGASIMTPVLIGVVLVAGGVGALVFQRKRRKV